MMDIKDVMTRNLHTVTPDATIQEAAQIMAREDVGIVPVVDTNERQRLVGVITDRDIAVRCVAKGRGADCRVSEAMSSGRITTCRENEHINRVMDAMRTEKVRRIPIVDERGSLVGIVSQADVVRKSRDGSRAERTIEDISEPGGRHAQHAD
jgi:CBS domain-containing protein